MSTVKVLKEEDNKVVYLVSGVSFSLANALRRSIMEEVPVLAIEDVTFNKNTSALYDEIIAHRLGSIPLTTDLGSYDLIPDDGKAKKGARYQLVLSLEAKGPCIVYAENLKSKDPKIKPVFPKMPITKLLKGQVLQIDCVAVLGQGKDHVKFSPGLVFYRAVPNLKVSKDSNVKKAVEMSGNLIAKGSGIEFKDLAEWNEAQEEICEDNGIEVEYSEDEFIFTVESWGQLNPRKLIDLGVEYFNKRLKELGK